MGVPQDLKVSVLGLGGKADRGIEVGVGWVGRDEPSGRRRNRILVPSR